jgi:hypothetical protein
VKQSNSNGPQWSYGLVMGKGLAVFADTFIPVGEVIMENMYRTICKSEKAALCSSEIYEYLFVDRQQYMDKTTLPCDLHLVFGAISLINHSNIPNCDLIWDPTKDLPTVKLLSTRAITPGEELSIFYTNIDEYPIEEFVFDNETALRVSVQPEIMINRLKTI